jgi:diguanylate cyclase (GGDEF)-like protein
VEATARKPTVSVPGWSLSELVHSCQTIYQKAVDAYRMLANSATSEEISRLWRDMAEGLNKQILYWRKISDLVDKNPNLEILGNPHAAIQQLRLVESRIDKIQESSSAFRSAMDYFYLAYSIEVQLIHPVLCSLPKSVMLIPDREVVKWDYQSNLKRLLSGMKKHCQADYLDVALFESLQRMWEQNRRLEEQDSVDPVTGAYNRRSLLKVISAFSSQAERDGHNVAIIMIGIGNIHELYRAFDLKTADEVVRRFFSSIIPGIRASDIIGRYNFSTFLVYLSKVNHQYLYDIAKRFSESASMIHKAGFVLSVHMGGSYGQIQPHAGQRIDYYVRKAWDCLMRGNLSRTQKIIIE